MQARDIGAKLQSLTTSRFLSQAMTKRHLAAILLAAALSGCAATPRLDTSAVDLSLTPLAAAARDPAPAGTVHWGGRIIAVRTVDDTTELEVLSYPLTSGGSVETGGASDGRFIAVRDGFVDPLVYAEGHTVTVVGRIDGFREGRVGEQPFRWPVIKVADMAPAPEKQPGGVVPFFSIGVGIGF
jgi:outer membrane lipoprotein